MLRKDLRVLQHAFASPGIFHYFPRGLGLQLWCECIDLGKNASFCKTHDDFRRRLAAAAANSPSLRALDVTANAQHGDDWMEVLGRPLAHCLAEAKCLKIVTLSCPENQLKARKNGWMDVDGAETFNFFWYLHV